MNRLIKWVFEWLYSDYLYPFTQADKEFEVMTKEERFHYLDAAKRFQRSECYKREMEIIVSKFYRDLATKAMNKTDVSAYRMALIFIRQFEQRITYLSQRYDAEDALDRHLRK
jgi:hypothetical protein